MKCERYFVQQQIFLLLDIPAATFTSSYRSNC